MHAPWISIGSATNRDTGKFEKKNVGSATHWDSMGDAPAKSRTLWQWAPSLSLSAFASWCTSRSKDNLMLACGRLAIIITIFIVIVIVISTVKEQANAGVWKLGY